MNLANFLHDNTPDLVSFRDPTIQTDNVLDRRSGGVATSIADKDGIWRPNPSDIGTVATHDKIKNRSEKLAYRKYIKDFEFETSKILERENIDRENIKEIETRLSMTRIDKQKMENIEERENIDDIPTRIEMTQSEHSSTPNVEKHMSKVSSEPDPSSSDSSDFSSLSDSAPKKKKSKKKKSVASIEKMTRQTHPRVMTLMTLIHPRIVIIDIDDAKIRNIGKRIRSDYAQL